MLFSDVSLIFDKISHISGRTEITKLLAQLFGQADPEEAQIISYLTQGLLRPSYEHTHFGMAGKSIEPVIASVLGIAVPDVVKKTHELGDLGDVIATGSWQPRQQMTVRDVYDRLTDLESLSGTGSQEEKAQNLIELLRDVDPISAKIIVRIILGALRLGFSDMTIIDSLSWMLEGNKSLHDRIENAYNLCADLGRIAFMLRRDGIAGLNNIDAVVGIPIRPAAAERLPTASDIIKKLGPCVAQPKIDGFRVQVHIKREHNQQKIWFFSRNLLNMSAMFPDLVAALENYNFDSLIIEGEAVAYDEKTNSFLPFQETVKRKRKHDIEEITAALPLRLVLFDILYYDGQSQLIKNHSQRRVQLLELFAADHKSIISVIEERLVSEACQIEDYLEENLVAGLEGLVIKRPDSVYQPGKRNFNWIKLKVNEDSALEDTIDAVILGYYYGRGKRAEFGIGAFLVGVYNPTHDRFETIAKVGTGLKDADWRDLKKLCDQNAVSEQPHNVICAKELFPSVWVYPKIVCTVRADQITRSPNHTAGKTENHDGFALRFPRFVGYRIDKSAQEATTVDEIKHMAKDQKK